MRVDKEILPEPSVELVSTVELSEPVVEITPEIPAESNIETETTTHLPDIKSSTLPVPTSATEADKKKTRAERFGIITSANELAAQNQEAPSNSDLTERLKKRAEKYGIISPLLVNEEAEKRKKEQVIFLNSEIYTAYFILLLFLFFIEGSEEIGEISSFW